MLNFFKTDYQISHYDVQALLIMAAYPPSPTETDGFAGRRADWAYILLGQAIRLAEIVGIFKPQTYPAGLEDQYARTAVCCFLLDVLCVSLRGLW